MLNMVRADSYRFFRGRTFKLCLLFTFAWVILCAFILKETIPMREAQTGAKINIDYLNSFWSYHPVMIPLLTFCCMEYITDFKQKTIKLYAAKGISRWSFYLSKILMGWLVALIFVVAALVAGMVSNVVLWGGNIAAYADIHVIGLIFAQWLVHATAATFIISIVFLMRGSTMCSVVNVLLLVYGYLILNKIELAMGQDGLITRFWLYSNIGGIEMGNLMHMLPKLLLMFAGYFVVCGTIAGALFNKLDIE